MWCRELLSIRASHALFVLGLLQWSCSAATWQGIAQGVAQGAVASPDNSGPAATYGRTKFMLAQGRALRWHVHGSPSLPPIGNVIRPGATAMEGLLGDADKLDDSILEGVHSAHD